MNGTGNLEINSHQRNIRAVSRGVRLSIAVFVLMSTLIARADSRSYSSTSSPAAQLTITPSNVECDRDKDGAHSRIEGCGGSDCNDSDATVNPSIAESSASACSDAKDNDCDGLADCADSECAQMRVFLPRSVSLEPKGLCCPGAAQGAQGVDPSSDPKNCGRCGKECGHQESCINGICISKCETALTACFSEPIPFQRPIRRGSDGRYPRAIQDMIDKYTGNPDCPAPMSEPKFSVDTFAVPIVDVTGRTDQSVRGLCVRMRF